MRRLTLLAAAALAVACADSTAPRNLIASCEDPGANPDTCAPPPPPQDSALVCMVSYDAATNSWSEWCGYIPVTP